MTLRASPARTTLHQLVLVTTRTVADENDYDHEVLDLVNTVLRTVIDRAQLEIDTGREEIPGRADLVKGAELLLTEMGAQR